MLGAWRGVKAPTPKLTLCSLADPRHSSSLLILEPLPKPPPRGGGADGEAQTAASVTSEGDVSPNVRAGLAGTGDLELLRSGEGGGGRVEGGLP